MRILGLVSATAIAGLVVACGAKDYSVGNATVTAAEPSGISNGDAIERIATERCNRELSCDQIGPERLWLTMADCRRDVRRDTRDYLDSDGCDHGVDAYGLASCVDSIRNARCDDQGQNVPGLVECRAAKLCR